MSKQTHSCGFTLIELLVIIGILAVFAIVAFVALNPTSKLKSARDAMRFNDASEILSSIKLYELDNKDSNFSRSMENLVSGQVFMIGISKDHCDEQNDYCKKDVSSPTHCLDLSDLISEGYLAEIPIAPTGKVVWSSAITGYTIEKDDAGKISIRSCEAEKQDEIVVSQ